MEYVVYIITNISSGKSYIGQTKKGLAFRWHEHCFHAERGDSGALYAAIRKHGRASFRLHILDKTADPDCANWLEGQWILARGTHRSSYGYNCTLGGGVYYPNEQTRQKISTALKGRISPTKGKVYSQEQRMAMSERRKGKCHLTEAGRQRIRESKLGSKNPNYRKPMGVPHD